MIAKMRKYSFLVYEPEYETFLKKLRDLGVVHIRNRANPNDIDVVSDLLQQQKELELLKRKLQRIQSTGTKEDKKGSVEEISHRELSQNIFTDYHSYVSELINIEQQIQKKRTLIDAIQADINVLSSWGRFDQSLLDELSKKGFTIQFWTVLANNYNEEWEKYYQAQIINQVGRSIYFITITSGLKSEDLEFAELVQLPQHSLDALIEERELKLKELELEERTLLYLSLKDDIVNQEHIKLQNEYQFTNAYHQGERLYDGKLVLVDGWVLDELGENLENVLDQERYAYQELQITESDDVPIKLKNNRFVRAFEPIVNLFSLPNYHELDPSPFIAPFFLLFFGICFGDAGYGVLLLAVCTYLKIKAKESVKPALELFQWLGLAGIIIGFFSGSFFGIALVEVPYLQAIKHYFISSDNMMVISIALGLIQILFAKYVSAFKTRKQKGMKFALSKFAWPTLIIMLGIIIALPQLKIQLSQTIEYILWGFAILCMAVVLLYNNPKSNIFLNVGTGIWDAYSTASGLLGDTLSYIRLFAIGLTGAILGQVFNNLAITATSGLPIVAAIPIGLVILLAGHTINIGLTIIGAVVHPIRLIFVEYFNNSDYEGGGKPYDPLRKK